MSVENVELVEKWETFYRRYYKNEIGKLAQDYPDDRSLHIDFLDIYQYDSELAEDLLDHPEEMLDYAEKALRDFDLPIDVSLGQAHVRIHNLSEKTGIRDIRSRHVNKLISVEGIVRKATEVRPKVLEAAFECQRCGTLTRISQSGGEFREPYECSGCERKGPFSLIYDQSDFVDSQKLRVQESPEGLRGGQTPQKIDVNIEDDITGEVTAGDRVVVSGILRAKQEESTTFDVFMEGVNVEIEDQEFEDFEISDEDEEAIEEIAASPNLYQKMVESMAPSIYGYEDEKLAMILQLFSGVTKRLPDNTRIRGDMHILLVGDPGTAKCVSPDTRVTLKDGSNLRIDELVNQKLENPKDVDDGIYDDVNFELPSLDYDGKVTHKTATRVWKREAPQEMYRITTASGKEVEVTPTHPLFVQSEGKIRGERARNLTEGEFIATPRDIPMNGDDTIDVDYCRSQSHNAVRLDNPEELTPSLSKLLGYIASEGYVQKRDDNTACLYITNDGETVLHEVKKGLDKLGVNYFERQTHEEKTAREVVCSSSEFVSFLENLDAGLTKNSSDKRVPNVLMSSTDSNKAEFLKAFFEGDGTVSRKQREISISSTSHGMIEDLQTLMLQFGIHSHIESSNGYSRKLRVSGKNLEKYIEKIGNVPGEKKEIASSHSSEHNTKTDVVPSIGEKLERVRTRLGLSQFECGIPRTTYQHYERGDRNPSRESLSKVVEAFDERLHGLRRMKDTLENSEDVGWDKIREIRKDLNISQSTLADSVGVSQSMIGKYERGEVELGGLKLRLDSIIKLLVNEIDEVVSSVKEDILDLRKLYETSIYWDRIEEIERVEPEYDFVYDLEVEDTHNFVTNNIFSHNSQLLQYVQKISPRGIYTSGKGSTSAGLCVTGDTLIHTKNGFRRIEELACHKHPDSVESNQAEEHEIPLYTYDEEDRTVKLEESSHVWRMPQKDCREIETTRGKKLETSVNTPVLVCGDDGIEWKAIEEVDKGDFVAVPKYSHVERSTPPIHEFLEFTNEKLKLDYSSVEKLVERLKDKHGTLKETASELGFNEDFIYISLRKRFVPIEKLERILDDLSLSISDLNVERAMLRHGDDFRVPERFNEDLMYLIGLVFGDGDISVSRRGESRGMLRISNSDEDILKRASEIIESEFDKQVEIERQEGRVPTIRLNSATITRFFEEIGMETPKNSLSLDDRLTTSEYADSFLRGLMDADGEISVRDEGGSSIQFSTISGELATQVQLMLETYGVHAKKRERDRRGLNELDSGYEIESKSIQYHIEIYGRDVDEYAERIGFESEEKTDALERLVGSKDRRGETLPVGQMLTESDVESGYHHAYLDRGSNPGGERAKQILQEVELGDVEGRLDEAVESSLVWDEVTQVRDTGKNELFDLTVPDTHNFVANGIITHNTAAAVQDDFGDGKWTLEAGALVLADKGIACVDEVDKMRCVTGDTLVQMGDGEILPISEISLRAEERASETEDVGNGRTIRLDQDSEEMCVFTKTDDNTIVQRRIEAVHEYEIPDELCEVRIESGESIKTTPCHPFFVFEEGERRKKSAEELEDGDWVYVPEELPRGISDGGIVSEPNSDGKQTRTRTKASRGAANTDSPSSVEPIDDSNLSESGAKILGYLSGDGNIYYNRDEGSYGIRFTNKEKQLIDDFRDACRDAFEEEPVIHPSEKRDDGVETVRLHGKEYVDELLRNGINLETYEGKQVPESVTNASRGAKTNYIKALADSEGCVDSQSANVKIYSSSYRLLLGVKMVLTDLGISSQIQTRRRNEKRDLYVLAITSKESLERFDEHIGFTLERKQEELEKACENAEGDRTILDVLPECGDLLHEIRTGLRLYQSECGLNSTTYLNFEKNQANTSLGNAETILEEFEKRKQQVESDIQTLESNSRELEWEVFDELIERYHITQDELAGEIGTYQQKISRKWGEEDLKRDVRNALIKLLKDVSSMDLVPLRYLVNGDIKWRRVSEVNKVDSDELTQPDTKIQVLLHRLVDELGVSGISKEEVEEEVKAILEEDVEPDSWDSLKDELERHGIPLERVAEEMDVSSATVSRWFTGKVRIGNFDEVESQCLELIEEKRSRLRDILNEIRKRKSEKVYDLTVEGTHNFIANGIVVHNSEDRSALHEALEQQSVSISKAGINATLKSRCSLLGAANPKYGRFDEFEGIAEQIDLEPALISRFDLIFTVTDNPDEEEDERLAKHILMTNYAGELAESGGDAEQAMEEIQPDIGPELFRKYVAYSRRNCNPRMTDEARERLVDFYVNMRAKGEEDSAIPVTARKLEALVRLAEASARVRLSDKVSVEDADRAIDITRKSLEQVGMDPESGEFDADIIETGHSKSQRDRIKGINEIIKTLSEENEENKAAISDVLDMAEENGVDREKAEDEIEALKRRGEIIEPEMGYLRVV